jgi:copper chaperone CopZ
MNDETNNGMANERPDGPATGDGHLHFPLRGLASEGADEAVREALAGLPGIRSIQVSTGIAIAEVLFDETVVSADEIRTRLEHAGQRGSKTNPEAAP